jgi:Leucine-rich repeat (LRR) protein
LTYLNVSGNPLRKLVLGELPALRANRLTSVPDWLAELPRLEKLDLRWNEVCHPPPGLVGRGCVVLCE